MPLLQEPMDLRARPSLARRLLRIGTIVFLTTATFVILLSLIVLAVTD
jgi:hypothetical protein